MDSLTQIALGAACGEIVAGKKIGNRAMLWGAVGGTIPDLDVFATFFTDEITATAFHRGFMHSFLFAVLAPFLLAKLMTWFYQKDIHRRQGYKLAAMSLWAIFYVGAAAGINFIPVLLGEGLKWYILVPTLLLGGWFFRKLWVDYFKRDLPTVEVSYWTWVSLFFWSIFTHPILDCFTSWGTQIFQPFNDLRVQWSTVSVVDPIATLPFCIALIIVSRWHRTTNARQWWLWAGMIWFCGYVGGYTVYRKWKVSRIFENSLHAQKIDYQRLMTNPTIFNNILWMGVAEGDTCYYHGLYSFNDCEERVIRFNVLPKNHHLLPKMGLNERSEKFIRWFSDGYFNIVETEDNQLHINDLRFGLLSDSVRSHRSYVFPFEVVETPRGNELHHIRDLNNREQSFSGLWQRLRGVCQ